MCAWLAVTHTSVCVLNTVQRAVILELNIFEHFVRKIIFIVENTYPYDVCSIVIPHIFKKKN